MEVLATDASCARELRRCGSVRDAVGMSASRSGWRCQLDGSGVSRHSREARARCGGTLCASASMALFAWSWMSQESDPQNC